MRVYDKFSSKTLEYDFSKRPGNDKRAQAALWEVQEIDKDEQLIGFYFQKWGCSAIKRFGLLTVNWQN